MNQTTTVPTQCGDTDLHVPHDACPGLDGTETDPRKPPRPVVDLDAAYPGAIPGWSHLILNETGLVLCGWTDENAFHAYSSAEDIATQLRNFYENEAHQ